MVPAQRTHRAHSAKTRASRLASSPTSKSISRRERKKQVTHQRLLECAWRLFQQQGYDDTTVEDITEAADVAKGTLFNYFETKQALLDEIALWRIEVIGDHVLASKDVPQSAVARIKLILEAMSDDLSPERDLTRHMLAARVSAPIKHESAHRLGSLVLQLVQQGQSTGEIRDDVDAGLIARLLMVCFFHSPHPRGSPHDTRETIHTCPPSETSDRIPSRPTESVDKLLEGLGGPEWRKR